jgi:hypothetical protein
MEHQEQHRQEARRRMVEQERQRLLDEHASKLLGYLPKVRGREAMGYVTWHLLRG